MKTQVKIWEKKFQLIFVLAIFNIFMLLVPGIAHSQEYPASIDQIYNSEVNKAPQFVALWEAYEFTHDPKYVKKVLDSYVKIASNKRLNVNDISFAASLMQRGERVLMESSKFKNVSLKYRDDLKLAYAFVVSSAALTEIGMHAAKSAEVKTLIENYLKNPIDTGIKQSLQKQLFYSTHPHAARSSLCSFFTTEEGLIPNKLNDLNDHLKYVFQRTDSVHIFTMFKGNLEDNITYQLVLRKNGKEIKKLGGFKLRDDAVGKKAQMQLRSHLLLPKGSLQSGIYHVSMIVSANDKIKEILDYEFLVL